MKGRVMTVPFMSQLPVGFRGEKIAVGANCFAHLSGKVIVLVSLQDEIFEQDLRDFGVQTETRTTREVYLASLEARYVISIDDRQRFTLWK
jgi:hypothetical protein